MVILACCIFQANAHPFGDEIENYKLMMRTFLKGQKADENDPKTNIELLSNWLSNLDSEIVLKEEVKRSHRAMQNAQKLMNTPTCGPEEIPMLNDLREIRKRKLQLYADHIDNIIDEIIGQYADKCRSTLTANIANYLNNLDAKDKTSLMALAQQMPDGWFEPKLIVEGVYSAISAHTEDPLVGSMLSENKSKRSTLKQFEFIYTKYVVEPCERMQATTSWLNDGLNLDIQLLDKIMWKGPINTFDLVNQSCGLVLSNKCVEGMGHSYRGRKWLIYGDLKEAVKKYIETTTRTKISKPFLGGRR